MAVLIHLTTGNVPTFAIPPSAKDKSISQLAELALKKDVDAQCALATHRLLEGKETEAVSLYKELWKADHLETIYCISNLRASGWGVIKQDLKSSVRLLKYLSCRDYGPGAYLLGFCYHYGERGVERDIDQAIEHYGRAAVQEEPLACFALGLLHYYGRDGAVQDMERGEQLLQRAAKLGIRDAQTILDEEQ